MEQQKKRRGPIQKIKDWWDGLSYNQQLGITVGVWAMDGAIWGSLITAMHKDRQMKRVAQSAAAEGYLVGRCDAFKELAQNPYGMMDAGMKKLEQQGKVKHF